MDTVMIRLRTGLKFPTDARISLVNRDFIREYISYVRVEKGLSKNSLEAYERDLRKLDAWTAKNRLQLLSLTRQDLREWLIDLSGGRISESSKRRLISSVRGFYKFLMIDGHLEKSPAEDLETPLKSFYLPKFLTQHEMELLLSQPDVETGLGLRDRAMLELMYACGLRVSEVVDLKVQNADLDGGILTCTGKGSKTRRVPIGKNAVKWLRAYLAERRKIENITVDNLFVSTFGKPLNRQQIHSMIKEHSEKCGLKNVSPHTLRHSFATHLIQNRADIRSVQQMLGHADISTTQIYTHITDAHLKTAYENFHPRSKKG